MKRKHKTYKENIQKHTKKSQTNATQNNLKNTQINLLKQKYTYNKHTRKNLHKHTHNNLKNNTEKKHKNTH